MKITYLLSFIKAFSEELNKLKLEFSDLKKQEEEWLAKEDELRKKEKVYIIYVLLFTCYLYPYWIMLSFDIITSNKIFCLLVNIIFF